MADQTITRAALRAAIEKGIAAAEARLAVWPESRFEQVDDPAQPPRRIPRTWRAKLRKVGRDAARVTVASFQACPLTQAGLDNDRRPAPALRAFAAAFDASASAATGGVGRHVGRRVVD